MPEDIAPAAVSSEPYMQMSCADLAQHRRSREADLRRHVEQQTQTAHRDRAWMTIIHLPVASIANGDLEPQIASLKGQISTISQISQSRGC